MKPVALVALTLLCTLYFVVAGCDAPTAPLRAPWVDVSVESDLVDADLGPELLVPKARCDGDDLISVSQQIVSAESLSYGVIERNREYRRLVLCEGESDWFKWTTYDNVGDQHVIVIDEQLDPGDCWRVFVNDHPSGFPSPQYTEQLSPNSVAFTFRMTGEEWDLDTTYYLQVFKSAGCVGGSRIGANYKLKVLAPCLGDEDCAWSNRIRWCRPEVGTCNPCNAETQIGCESAEDGRRCIRMKTRDRCGCESDADCPQGTTCAVELSRCQ